MNQTMTTMTTMTTIVPSPMYIWNHLPRYFRTIGNP